MDTGRNDRHTTEHEFPPLFGRRFYLEGTKTGNSKVIDAVRLFIIIAFASSVLCGAPPAMSRNIEATFPEKSLGVLRTVPQNEWRCKAQGKLTLPESSRYELVVSYYGASSLDFLRTLPPGFIKVLNLINLEMDDERFLKLKGADGLEEIMTNESEISDRGLAVLAGMPNLTYLWISNSAVKGFGLAPLKNLSTLKFLNLSFNQLDTKTLVNFKNFTHLETLSLVKSELNDTGLGYLKSLWTLKRLDISRNPAITDDGLSALVNLKKLKILDVSYTKITAKSLRYLKELPSLTELRVTLSKLPAADAGAFRKQLPKCAITDIESLNRNNVPTEFFAPLK